MELTSISLVEAILEREAAETRDCTDIKRADPAEEGHPYSALEEAGRYQPTKRFKYSDLFGYVRLGPDGTVIERSNDPPSKWRPEIKAMVGR